MCDQCTDRNSSHFHVSQKFSLQRHQSNVSSSEQSSQAHSADHDFIDAIWRVIAISLDLLDAQLNEERQRRTLGFFTNAFDSTKVEQGPNVASCLSKVDGASQMHN